MSDRFIKFNDEQLDAKQVMMLQDLARLLLKMSKHKLKFKNSLTMIQLITHHHKLVLVAPSRAYRESRS